MKKIKGITALLLSAVFVLSLAACSKDSVKLEIDQPKSISTIEDGEEATVSDAIEASENVNGKRFALTLHEFTVRYNTAKRLVKDTDLIIEGNWREMGDPETDNKGIDFQYYYYDDHNVNITATEEIESGKLMNVGVGTTMSHFMAEESGENNSDNILRKAALMADAACCFGSDKIDTLQDIFYQIATGPEDSLWYEGFVFSLSTKENKTDNKNGIMLFRVFPVTDDLRKEWRLTDYKPSKKNS